MRRGIHKWDIPKQRKGILVNVMIEPSCLQWRCVLTEFHRRLTIYHIGEERIMAIRFAVLYCLMIQCMFFKDRQGNGAATVFSDVPPKIYRRTFFEQKDNIIYRERGKEEIPIQFKDCRFVDVTRLHNVECRDVSINLTHRPPNKIAYLAVFSPQGWIPVAFGEIRGHTAVFKDVGTNVLYLPCIYDNGSLISISNPVVIKEGAIECIAPMEYSEKAVLTRKYPRTERIIMFAGYMDGGLFEAACKSDFSDATSLYRVDGIPYSRMQSIECNTKCRYIRYRKPSGVFSLGEMRFRDTEGDILKGEIVFPDGFEGLPRLTNVVDGDSLTYLELTGLTDVWVGLDFGKEVEVGSVEFSPRTDDNDVSPGDNYELLYWDGQAWESIGVDRAKGYEICFDKVPVGALLWLRDLTKGKEERPFLYKDGVQIWL